VEGRADVINLLKNDITNCVAVGGATGVIPKTIIDLSKSKETVLFLDGDRGGDMILRGLSNVCEVDFVVRAPDGKEVEELTRKDIIKALRTKIPIEQALSRLNHGNGHGGSGRPPFGSRPQRFEQRRDFTKASGAAASAAPVHACRGAAPMEQRSEPVLSPTEISRNMFSKDRDIAKKVERPITYEGMLEEVNSDSGNIKDMDGNEVDFTPSPRGLRSASSRGRRLRAPQVAVPSLRPTRSSHPRLTSSTTRSGAGYTTHREARSQRSPYGS
jgi:DNA primase